MRIAIGCDHTAAELAAVIRRHLEGQGVEVTDFTPCGGEWEGYPVYAERVAVAVRDGQCGAGVLICGTGAGMAITANKIRGVRAVSCSEAYTARMAKEHNNANILCFGARVVGSEVAKTITDAWLTAEFQGERHLKRVGIIDEIEKRHSGAGVAG